MKETEQVFSNKIYQDIFGITDSKEIQFADDLAKSINKLDENLLPFPIKHPFAKWIYLGKAGLDYLLQVVEKTDKKAEKWEALDGVAQIFLQGGATPEAIAFLKKHLPLQDNREDIAYFAKCIALSKDEAFLVEQMQRLVDDDPAIVAAAARLLGYGAFRPAVPILKALVGPEHMFESRYVIWALGEIGDPEALPILEKALEQGFRTVDALVAIGKIGQVASLPQLMPFLLQGLPEQLEAAYQAFASILHQNRDVKGVTGLLGDQLKGIIAQQLENFTVQNVVPATRFYALLCFARLGGHLEPSLMRKYLGIELDEKQAGDMAAFFMRRNNKMQ